MKVVQHLANLGYGSRKEVMHMLRDGRVLDAKGDPVDADSKVDLDTLRVDDEPVDPGPGLIVMLHKPTGYTCSRSDGGNLVYDLLPMRFAMRKPALSSVGRLDRDTSGLLLFTDDGVLLHRLTSPKAHLPKIYEAQLAHDLRGDEAAIFASGTLTLESEVEPLAPATMEVVTPRSVRLTLTEGRYHQIRRMFAAVGNHVEALHRARIGDLTLGDLPEGEWRPVPRATLMQLTLERGQAAPASSPQV